MPLVSLGLIPWIVIYSVDSAIQHLNNRGQILLSYSPQGWIQFFFLGGGALVSCSTSTPINHIVFFFCRIPVVLENCRSSQGGGLNFFIKKFRGFTKLIARYVLTGVHWPRFFFFFFFAKFFIELKTSFTMLLKNKH